MDLLIAGVVVAALMLVLGGIRWNALQREKRILAKYGDGHLARAIIAGTVRTGMTYDHVIDTLGKPADIEEEHLKTKTKITFKYHGEGGNRYRLRIMFENGVVAGWQDRR